jgi:GT2 family glycosyltransferase
MKRVAALILNYDLHSRTDSVVKDLQDLDVQNIDLSVWVIDNGSKEPYHNDKVQVMRLDQNRFFSGGFNEGIRRARAVAGFDYYWLLSNDIMFIFKDTLVALVQDMAVHKDAGIVVPAVTFDSSRPGANVQFMLRGSGTGVKSLRWAEWQAPLMSATAIDRVGLLDENLRFYGMDLDWCYRASKLGFCTIIDYRVYIQHGHGTTIDAHPDMAVCTPEECTRQMDEAMTAKYGKQWYNNLWPENGRNFARFQEECGR